MDGMAGSGRRALWIGTGVVAVALVLRLWNLGQPAHTVFDEYWYTFDAVAYLGGGPSSRPRPWWPSGTTPPPSTPRSGSG
jgi:hypothetical protein